eukprot:gb/GECH01001076.1/.p1 GENE.gb/GECH01001076.1/~~gb/GECH01001076.1/.p1  ORF type:complete len:344 (+),score=111.66 gb/GECH01001076.1/:1-1032(+)
MSIEPKTPVSGRRSNSVFRVNKPTRYTLQRKWFQSVEAILVQRDVFEWIGKMVKISSRLNSSPTLRSHLNSIEKAKHACISIADDIESKELTDEYSSIEQAFSILADGELLCELVWCIDKNALDIRKVKFVEEGPSGRRAFKRRDNISRFLSGCQQLGISKAHLFDPSSLISLAASTPGQGPQHVHRKQVLATLTTLMDHYSAQEESSSEESFSESSEDDEYNDDNNDNYNDDNDDDDSNSDDDNDNNEDTSNDSDENENEKNIEKKNEQDSFQDQYKKQMNEYSNIQESTEDALKQTILNLEKELKNEREKRYKANEMLKAALEHNSSLAKENYFLKKHYQQ